MRRFRLGIGLFAVSVGFAFEPISHLSPVQSQTVAIAQDSAEPISLQSTPPPLIERELFFSDPEITGARLSPNGQFIAFQKPLDGVLNVWVKGIDEPMEAARPVTADAQSPIMIYRWSADGRYILYGQDTGGDENFRLYTVEPEVIGEAGPQLELLDIGTGETELVETAPEQQVDFGGAMFSPATDELVATYYVGDRSRIYPKSDELKRCSRAQGDRQGKGQMTLGDRCSCSVENSRESAKNQSRMYCHSKKYIEINQVP
ncbi:MAG: hypothetical protein AAFR12_13110 [Cyanobacteria bacterium J06626_6]